MARGYRDEDRYNPPWRQPGAECIRETDRALLVLLKNGEERWFPKSVIHDDSEVYEVGGSGEIVVQAWFSEKEGLDE